MTEITPGVLSRFTRNISLTAGMWGAFIMQTCSILVCTGSSWPNSSTACISCTCLHVVCGYFGSGVGDGGLNAVCGVAGSLLTVIYGTVDEPVTLSARGFMGRRYYSVILFTLDGTMQYANHFKHINR